jgi:hypothetical protein
MWNILLYWIAAGVVATFLNYLYWNTYPDAGDETKY